MLELIVCMEAVKRTGEQSVGSVVSQDELIVRRADWKRNGRRVVFASGSFDLLHPGHVRLLEQARSHGDIVVVGIEAGVNASAAHLPKTQAARRAVTPPAERAEIVAALAAVDFVVELAPGSLPAYAARLAPDVFVQGGDPASGRAALDQNAGRRADEPASRDGKLVLIPLEPGHSTARLIERIKNLDA
jgi:rfaE bifunctional protein nucleotidyltransferase chain/domain